MGRRCLMVAIASVLVALGCDQSVGQDVGRLRYIASPDEIARFFQGKLQADSLPARYNARYLHLMGERPLVEAKGPEATQVYRLLLDTHPYDIPVVVRLSVAPDGTGEVVVKIGHSARFPDILTENRTAKLSQADIDKFLKLLEGSDSRSLPVFGNIDLNHAPMGDPGWMFEGAKEGSYHVVCRGTSGLASLRNAVMFLQHVSKLDLASTKTRPQEPMSK